MNQPTRPEVVRLRRSGLWIVWGCPWPDRQWCGPYRTEREARHGDGGLDDIRRAVEMGECNVDSTG